MLALILPFLLVSLILYLWVQDWRSRASSSGHLLRLVAVGISAVLVTWLGQAAVATERLMLGLGAAVLICETFLWIPKTRNIKPLRGILEILPVIVPLLMISPYRSMITYFFGFDIAILAFSLVVVLSYAALSYSSTGRWRRTIHSILAGFSVTMLLWMSLKEVNGIV
jgi:hypothetical protein